jgi:hypothetical protein
MARTDTRLRTLKPEKGKDERLGGCRYCHKGLISAERSGGCKGDMTELRNLGLVCQPCGSRDRETKVFLRANEAEAWLEGLTVSPTGSGRPTFDRPQCQRRASFLLLASQVDGSVLVPHQPGRVCRVCHLGRAIKVDAEPIGNGRHHKAARDLAVS